jgi:hypothetical protein
MCRSWFFSDHLRSRRWFAGFNQEMDLAAQLYGPFTNGDLVGEALGFFREQVVIATKFGYMVGLDSRLESKPCFPQNLKETANR